VPWQADAQLVGAEPERTATAASEEVDRGIQLTLVGFKRQRQRSVGGQQ
jgi:hypothetical protein